MAEWLLSSDQTAVSAHYQLFKKRGEGNAGLLPECTIGNHSGDGSNLSTHGTLLLVCHSSYGPTINGRLLIDRTNYISLGQVEIASGKSRALNGTHKR